MHFDCRLNSYLNQHANLWQFWGVFGAGAHHQLVRAHTRSSHIALWQGERGTKMAAEAKVDADEIWEGGLSPNQLLPIRYSGDFLFPPKGAWHGWCTLDDLSDEELKDEKHRYQWRPAFGACCQKSPSWMLPVYSWSGLWSRRRSHHAKPRPIQRNTKAFMQMHRGWRARLEQAGRVNGVERTIVWPACEPACASPPPTPRPERTSLDKSFAGGRAHACPRSLPAPDQPLVIARLATPGSPGARGVPSLTACLPPVRWGATTWAAPGDA